MIICMYVYIYIILYYITLYYIILCYVILYYICISIIRVSLWDAWPYHVHPMFWPRHRGTTWESNGCTITFALKLHFGVTTLFRTKSYYIKRLVHKFMIHHDQGAGGSFSHSFVSDGVRWCTLCWCHGTRLLGDLGYDAVHPLFDFECQRCLAVLGWPGVFFDFGIQR